MESQLQLTIPKRQLAEIISHAYETDPEECCGVLFGRDGTILLSRPIPNVHRNRISRYMMDPLVLLQAYLFLLLQVPSHSQVEQASIALIL